jgi:hypothetical protein
MKGWGLMVWEKCLRGNRGTDEVLQKAANGSADHQKTLTAYLHKVLDTDAPLRQEAQKLAEAIHQVVQCDDVTARNVQQVFGGQADQFNTEHANAPMIQGGSGHTIQISYGTPPKA